MEELINVMDSDAKKNLQQLKDISNDEDNIIENLEFMERQLDKYIQIANPDGSNKPQASYLYESINNTNEMVNNVQKELDDIEKKIIRPLNNGSSNVNQIRIEENQNSENLRLDVNTYKF